MDQIPKLEFNRVMRILSRIRVRAGNQCWPWLGSKDDQGYGEIKIGYRLYGAHRVIAALQLGPHPEWAEVVMHTCDQPSCCNPGHLKYATQLTNYRDAMSKGRIPILRGSANSRSKLNDNDVMVIRASSESQNALARRYKVSQSCISHIQAGRSWSHI